MYKWHKLPQEERGGRNYMRTEAGKKWIPDNVWSKVDRNYRIHALEPGVSIFSSEIDNPSQTSTCYLCRVWKGGDKACLLQHPPDYWWRCVATIVADTGERYGTSVMTIAVASVDDEYEAGRDDWRIQSMFFSPEEMNEDDVWDSSRWCPLPKTVARRVFDRAALDNVREFDKYFPYLPEVRLFQVAYNPAHPAQMLRHCSPNLFAKKKKKDEKSPGTSSEMACLTEEDGKRRQ